MYVLVCDNPQCRYALDVAHLWHEIRSICEVCGVGYVTTIWVSQPPPDLARRTPVTEREWIYDHEARQGWWHERTYNRIGRRLTPEEHAALLPLVEEERRRIEEWKSQTGADPYADTD